MKKNADFYTVFDARDSSAALGALKPSANRLAIGPGMWNHLDNIRRNNGMPKSRGAMSAAISTILAGSSSAYRGHWSGKYFGIQYLLVAVYDGTRTRILKTTDLTTWAEITASSGAYGNTRLTGNAPVSFAAGDSIFACDGAGSVRNLSGLSSTATAPMATVLPQSTIQNIAVEVNVLQYAIGIEGANVYTPLDIAAAPQARLVAANNGASPDRQMRVTINTTTQLGDNIKLAAASATTVNNGSSELDRQFLLGVSTGYTLLWDKFKLETNAGEVLWDPTSTAYAPPVPVSVDASNKTIWAFNWPNPKSNVNRQYIILTWVAATAEAPSVAQTVDIWLMGYTYGTNARADMGLGVVNKNTQSKVVSPGVIYSEYETQRIKDWGGPVLGGAKIPRSGEFMANFKAPIKNVTTAERDLGVDAVEFYYADPGVGEYRYAGSLQTASYSAPNWAFTTGATGDLLYVNALSSLIGYETEEKFLPDAYHMAPPTCSAVGWIRKRAYFAAVGASGGDVYVSEYANSYRLRKFPRFVGGDLDESSPTSISFGGETVKRITSVSASLNGSNTVFFFTDGGVYTSRGLSVSSLSNVGQVCSHGTNSPFTVSVLNDRVYYLDSEMQVRVFSGGGSQVLSRNQVDILTKGVPSASRPYITSAGFDHLYYSFFAPSGATTNTRGLIWSDDGEGWVTDTPPLAIQGIANWFDTATNTHRLLAIASDGSDLKIYDYDLETEDQDLGTTDITVTFEPMEYCEVSQDGTVIGDVAIWCDANAGGSGSIARIYPNGVTATSTLALDPISGHSRIARWDGAQSNSSTVLDAIGESCRLTISLGLKSGANIYRIACKMVGGGNQYDGTD